MIQIGHHKEFLKLTFLELASSSEQIQQLFVVWGSYTERWSNAIGRNMATTSLDG